jgi:hypothetical protein
MIALAANKLFMRLKVANLLYKDESMCVCVCVCMYVCPAACRRAHTTHHPEIWHGLLISPWLGTEPGGDPKCWPLGVPLIVTLSENPWRVNNWAGASKPKLLLGVGLPCKILFVGGSPKPGAPQGPPYQMGVYALRIGRGPANKSCSLGWVCI